MGDQKDKYVALDNWHWLVGLADIAVPSAVALAILLNIGSGWLAAPQLALASLLVAASLKGASTFLHESSHGIVAKSRRLNAAIGAVAGAFVLQGRPQYMRSHLKSHHGGQGLEDEDPDYAEHLSLGLYHVRSRSEFIRRFVVLPLFGSQLPAYWRYLARDRVSPRSAAAAIGVGVTAGVASLFEPVGSLPALAFACWLLVLAYWLPNIGWFVELSEHFPMAGFEPGRTATRHRACGPVSRVFVGLVGERYHLLHHLRPDVPFWRLAELHNDLLATDLDYATMVERHGAGGWRPFGFLRQICSMFDELVTLRATGTLPRLPR